MDGNALAVLGAAIIAGAFSIFVTLRSGRVAAEAALLGMPGPIIAEQNKRIANLQDDINTLWNQLQDMYKREQQCQDELREYRHQNRDLMQKVVVLENKVEKLERKNDE
jgi:septal ring factor EnvC (AmiA/AmiB activator)